MTVRPPPQQMETNFFEILHFLVSVGACNLILRIHAVVN